MGDKSKTGPSNITWVTFNPVPAQGANRRTYASNEDRRRDVRSAAAKASAAARKATIARKELDRLKDGGLPVEAKPRVRKKPSIKRPPSPKTRAQDDGAIEGSRLLKGASMSSTVFEMTLWSSILSHCDLQYTAMLTTATPANYSAINHPNHVGPARACIIFLRGSALRSIYELSGNVSGSTKASEAFSASIAVMAGWEQKYGDSQWYDLHMKAWRDIVKPQQGDSWEREHVTGMADLVLRTARRRYCELAAQTQKCRGPIPASEDTMRTQSNEVIPQTPFDLDRPEARTLVHILTKLNNFDPTAPESGKAIHEMILMLFVWEPNRALPLSWLAEGDIDEELVEDLCLYHVRAALISITAAWSLLHSLATGAKQYLDVLETIDEHLRETRPLQTEVLMGTKYEEVALWSRFILTARAKPETWDTRSIGILRELLVKRNIDGWHELKTILKKWCFVDLVYDECGQELYQLLLGHALIKHEMEVVINEVGLSPL